MSPGHCAADIVEEAIGSYNQAMAAELRLPITSDTPLFGPEGSLDSLAMVNLIVSIEETAEERLGRYLPLADALGEILDHTPTGALTIGGLIDLVARLSADA